MGQANSDNNGANGALDKFFSVFNPSSAAGTYKNIDILINDVFCADDTAAGLPWVGIARHGPQFRGAANVKGLFHQLITTFPDIWWQDQRRTPKSHTCRGSTQTTPPNRRPSASRTTLSGHA